MMQGAPFHEDASTAVQGKVLSNFASRAEQRFWQVLDSGQEEVAGKPLLSERRDWEVPRCFIKVPRCFIKALFHFSEHAPTPLSH